MLGILTMLVPFSGLPGSVRTFLAVLLGAIVLGIGISERAAQVRSMKQASAPAVPAPQPDAPPTMSAM